ncbi:MobA/MobL family protein [Ferrovibrio sp.]|uniref:MobA/MobL family protein n=1 Tax=Ferrovibrio sp. TaxID=1917215 RepID=UPI003D27B7CB
MPAPDPTRKRHILLATTPPPREAIETLRQTWAQMVNETLACLDMSDRVDNRSYVRQAGPDGIPKLPMLRLGPFASRAGRSCKHVWAADENQRRHAINMAADAALFVLDFAVAPPPGPSERLCRTIRAR